MANFKHVDGKDKGKIVLYALSTCVWCKKTKKMLDSLGLSYDYIDVDQLEKEESDALENEVIKWSHKAIYPTIVVDGKKVISGYQEKDIKDLGK